MRVTTEITRRQFLILCGAFLGAFVLFFGLFNTPYAEAIEAKAESIETVQVQEEKAEIYIEAVAYEEILEEYEEIKSFPYYQISEAYIDNGGCFPEIVQEYLWEQCCERGIDYYIIIALIERESGYRHYVAGDSGNSIGYMQIYERWHKERMEEEDVTDLYNPYENIRVGLNFLGELFNRYEDWDKALMAYNMGESKAKDFWREGVYSSSYSREIRERAQEIQQEVEQD